MPCVAPGYLVLVPPLLIRHCRPITLLSYSTKANHFAATYAWQTYTTGRL